MSSFYDQIYAQSPVWLQNLGITAYGYMWGQRRYGGDFKKYVQDFKSRETYTLGEWQAYQTAVLKKMMSYVVEHVPYYRETFTSKFGVNYKNFELDNLSKLPLLEKNSIQSAPENFIGDDVLPGKLSTYHTSGTTGTPLAIKFSRTMHRLLSAAYEARVRRWAGVDYKMSRAMIGGRLVVPNAKSKPPFWRFNLAERQLYMSAFHISPQNAMYYVEALNRYKPDYLVGYASSHFFLARMIIEQGLNVLQPKAVLTSSEKLTSEMRTTIERAYRCDVFDAYSGVEACCLVSECEYHRFHISMDVGVIELVGENGKTVKPGEQGEIIATGLLNFEQPLIRYRTGDLAVLSDELCPCNNKMPVLKEIVGRLEDTVIGSNGQETVRFHGIFVGLPHICEGQIIQETLNNFRLRLVVQPEFNEQDKKILYQRFYDRMGPIELEMEIVDQIGRTEGGKFRAVISKVRRAPVLSIK